MTQDSAFTVDNAAWYRGGAKLSVLIPFKGDDPIPLLAALSHEAAACAEIVILDDGSEDQNLSFEVEAAVGLLPLPARFIRLARNEGRSKGRNPVLADIFGRLGYMERQGSGFKKITETYRAAHNYRDELEPKFYSDASSFQVTLYNLNYGTVATASKVTIEDENIAIEVAIDRLNASQGTIAKAKAVFANMGVDGVFGRSDIATITKDSVTAAGNLITKLKNADLIEPVSGFGKGKYKFIAPKE